MDDANEPVIGHIGPDRGFVDEGDELDVYDAITDLYLGLERADQRLDELTVAHGLRRTPDLDHEADNTIAYEDDAPIDSRVGSQDDAPARLPAFDPGQVGVLLLGHLPISGGAWAGQHVRTEADRLGHAVVLVRMRERVLSLDLVACADDPEGGRTGPRATILDAVHEARRSGALFLVQVGGEREASESVRAGASSITLLASEDDASRVATYRSIKGLVHDLGGDAAGASIRVVLLASDAERAERAGEQLRDACERFLGVTIITEVRPARIGSARAPRELYAGRFEGGASDVVGMLADEQDAPTPSLRLGDAPPRASSTIEARGPNTPPTHQPAPTAPAAGDDDAVERAPSDKQETPAGPDELASHLEGLTPMAARCPFERDVQFALDGANALHAMIDAEHDPREGLARLKVAGAWALEHRELLELTLGRDGRIADAPATPHLFVREPKAARRMLDTDVRVHLLREVACGAASVWVSAELN